MITHFPRQNYGDFARREGCIQVHPSRRPQWWKRMPKPFAVIGYSDDQIGCFLWTYSIRPTFKNPVNCFLSHEMTDILKHTARGKVAFILPFGFIDESTTQGHLTASLTREGIVPIRVTLEIARGRNWTDTESLVIATRIEMARQAAKIADKDETTEEPT